MSVHKINFGCICLCFERWKELLLGSKRFRFRVDPLRRGLVFRKANKVSKAVSVCKLVEYLPRLSGFLIRTAVRVYFPVNPGGSDCLSYLFT